MKGAALGKSFCQAEAKKKKTPQQRWCGEDPSIGWGLDQMTY